MSRQGTPVWYELTTNDPNAAQNFYSRVLDWTFKDSGMAGFDYRIGHAGNEGVCGVMAPPEAGMAPRWGIYFAVDNCDATARTVSDAGGKVCHGPADIPNVGRFAVLADPQGATFAILRAAGGDGRAFDQMKQGHGNWHELSTTDPKAALDFYGRIFGWTAGQAMDMGAMGTYQLFTHEGRDIGGMMPLGQASAPVWIPYFGAPGAEAAVSRIAAAGGTVLHGPAEVPGGAWIVSARDPQGAEFAVVGPK